MRGHSSGGNPSSPFPLDGGRAGDGGASAAAKKLHAPGAVSRARRLRREMTVGEKRLWDALRQLKLNVRRQSPVGRYVADFAIHRSKLIVEVDGPHHELPDRAAQDANRTAWLEGEGYRVLRFSAQDAVNETQRVVDTILSALSPLPPSRGKGEVF